MKKQMIAYLFLLVLGLAACSPATEPPPPTLPAGATMTDLKYQILTQFPTFFFCDPDYYPIQRADEAELAQKIFPVLQADTEEFPAILAHNGLGSFTTFSDEQMLLIYREHKKLAAISLMPDGDSYQFQIRIRELEAGLSVFKIQITEPGESGVGLTGLIDANGVIEVQERTSNQLECPLCLAAQTQIDTPKGVVAVADLRVGDTIWSVDGKGRRVTAVILQTAQTLAPANHQMVHITLSDGRELWASPGHPTSDGRTMHNLRLGSLLAGARITQLEQIPYNQPMTYDILPAGETGFYWANGILLGSTLKGHLFSE